jgi:hypothetical protein
MRSPTRPVREWREIAYGGGLLRFKIPAHWVEEYDKDESTAFHEPGDEERTLFVHVIKMEMPLGPESCEDQLAGSMARMAEGKNTECKTLPNGNLLMFHTVDGHDRGRDVRFYRWVIGSALPPGHARIATFTYCQPRSVAESREVKEFLCSIGRQLEETQFAPMLGVTPQ